MLDIIAHAVSLIVPLVVTNNLLISAVKYLSEGTAGKYMLRTLLGVFSIIGVVALSAFTGSEIDLNQTSELVYATVMIFLTGVASHFSYKAVVKAPKAD